MNVFRIPGLTLSTMSGSGKYPFTPPELTPSIDYFVTWTLKGIGPNKVRIKVEGKHDMFPAYEAVADWSIGIHQFTSPDSGPNRFNLNTPAPFSAEKRNHRRNAMLSRLAALAGTSLSPTDDFINRVIQNQKLPWVSVRSRKKVGAASFYPACVSLVFWLLLGSLHGATWTTGAVRRSEWFPRDR